MPGDCAGGAGCGDDANAPAVASCFACPYHGWTYDLSGRLIKATRLTGIEGFRAEDNGLRQGCTHSRVTRLVTWFILLPSISFSTAK
jgi:hypothetical protein